MKKIITTFIIVAIVVAITMYHNKQQSSAPTISDISLISVDGSLRHDAMATLIAPYKAQKDSAMNIIVGQATETMEVAKPESSLTRLIADVLLAEARKVDPEVHMAVTNIGGIRRPLFQGNITIGDVYEILPFDNSLLILEYKGETIIELANAIATKGGESISGIKLDIHDGKASNILINNQPINPERIYKVVTTDYLSWGNDQLAPLANHIQSTPLNLMMRDAMLNYLNDHNIVLAPKDNRIFSK
jgi:2',3'-cyclic-nucleotide 2'-phosphodiesterase (5'-nucleotidase family)